METNNISPLNLNFDHDDHAKDKINLKIEKNDKKDLTNLDNLYNNLYNEQKKRNK